ncbi:GFA family protein [Nitratireductor sp. GCM10026969]|uniref:GFA family protein n=1 Tax=Nitratireductor sp. GCM10026969 TaxID=3252645 RepID=UPI003615E926
MRDWKLPREGGCRCGQVRVRVSAPPLITMACHCTGCQRMSASAFSLSAAIPAEGFAVVEGEPVIGGLHGDSRHYFCPHCMTWMFTRPEGMDWFVNLRPTMLEGAEDFAPFIETWVAEKLDFAQTRAVHSYEALPPMDAYEGLMEAYQEWAGR